MYRQDADLTFLMDVPSEDLDALVHILTKNEDGEPRLTEELTQSVEYQIHKPDHHQYWELIAAELQCFGANTLVTFGRRGKGVLYEEILHDVCGKMKVNFNKNSSVAVVEANLLMKVLTDALGEMSTSDLKDVCKELDLKTTNLTGEAVAAALQILIKQAGFGAYKVAVIVANAVAKQMIGRGLSFAANAALARTIGILAGPIGWAITALWTVIDIAGAAYRVTIPATIMVAYLRIALAAGQLGEAPSLIPGESPKKEKKKKNKKKKKTKWHTIMETPMGPERGTLLLKTDGNVLTGKLSGSQEIEIKDGKVDGNSLAWKADIPTPMAMTLEFTATVDGDSLHGNVKLGAFGNASLTGTRA